jgi:hypothetical protein
MIGAILVTGGLAAAAWLAGRGTPPRVPVRIKSRDKNAEDR